MEKNNDLAEQHQAAYIYLSIYIYIIKMLSNDKALDRSAPGRYGVQSFGHMSAFELILVPMCRSRAISFLVSAYDCQKLFLTPCVLTKTVYVVSSLFAKKLERLEKNLYEVQGNPNLSGQGLLCFVDIQTIRFLALFTIHFDVLISQVDISTGALLFSY